jgi:hypothetical protein
LTALTLADLSKLSWAKGVGVPVAVTVALAVGLALALGVAVTVAVRVGVELRVGVALRVAEDVAVELGVRLGDALKVGEMVRVDVAVGARLLMVVMSALELAPTPNAVSTTAAVFVRLLFAAEGSTAPWTVTVRLWPAAKLKGPIAISLLPMSRQALFWA